MNKEKSFKELIQETRKILKEFEKQDGKWNAETIITELTKQLGEVSKQVMMLEGNYMPQRKKDQNHHYSKENLGYEMSDILFNLIRLADYYNIDLEQAHINKLKINSNRFSLKNDESK